MHDLEITWPGGQARFSPGDSPVTVGRSPDAAVILTDPSVSRRHIEFVWNGTAWTASDSSTHGSFDPIGVRLAPTWTVGTDTAVRLGGVEGVELRIELLTTPPPGIHDPLVAPRPQVEVEAPSLPPSLQDFVVPGAGPGPVRPTPIL
ncbi:MAG: FHA domain-containing protein, partial [Acidimicrobiia bacterium]|nr:FHA domain-containing protein [Acidimicrobiia bacterium]